MQDNPIAFETITSLGAKYRSGALSPVTVTEALLARIEALNGALNAFICVTAERALGEARAAELELRAGQDRGPLHGIPYAVKDIYDVKGVPTTAGSKLLAGNIAERDSHAVAQLARAGMVMLGKTQTVQFALGPIGLNSDFGAPHNPWHSVPRATGGSSSGSGVAVAAGLVPMALGSDTGGSVRIPSGLCGTVGFKPTFGRISRSGAYPLSWTLDTVGPLTRSVEDAALVYMALQGREEYDDTTHHVPPQKPLLTLGAGVKGMRLAVCETAAFENADPEVTDAFWAAVEVLRELGASVIPMEIPEVGEALADDDWGRGLKAEAAHFNARHMKENLDRIDPLVAYQLEDGRAFGASEYFGMKRRVAARKARLVQRLGDFDAFLTPTVTTPAEPLSELSAKEDYEKKEPRYWRNTSIANYFELCAASVPCGFSKDGMPIGLMVNAKPFQEESALRVAHAYAKATDWAERHPDLAWARAQG